MNMETIVFDPEIFKNPTSVAVSCECGKLQGVAEVKPRAKKNGREFKLAYQVTGEFFLDRDLLTCTQCGKKALSRFESGK